MIAYSIFYNLGCEFDQLELPCNSTKSRRRKCSKKSCKSIHFPRAGKRGTTTEIRDRKNGKNSVSIIFLHCTHPWIMKVEIS